MQTIRLAEAQSRLPALIDAVARGEEVLITRDDVPVARLTPASPTPAPRPTLRDLKPSSLGQILRPLASGDDLMTEMLDDRDRHQSAG